MGVDKVTVAILSWNGRQHLETCLEALAAQEDPGVPWEVLLLDNGSRDGTAEWARRHHPEARLITSPVNLGFCAGNNRLVEKASGDAVAFLNNDTRPRRDWLARLTAALAAAPAEVAAVSGCLVDWAGERLDFGRGAMTFDGHAFQLGFRRPLRRVTEAELPAAGAEVPFACGGNMLVRRRSFLDAGGFDESYFAYLEDVDLGWRLWAGGERILCAPEAVVHHRSAATSELLGLFHRGFLFERNAFLTAYKNYESGLWERVMPAVLLTLLERTRALLVRNNPGGDQLAVDPYAGLIADTAPAPSSPAPDDHPRTLLAKWRRYGTRELCGRALFQLSRRVWPQAPDPTPAPRLTDPRTVAQIRALSSLARHLDAAAERRRAVQARRRVSDAEIFARFPPYLVPTYPGDRELFATPGFRAWLPEDLPLIESTLEEVMEMG